MSICHNLPTAYYLTGFNAAKKLEQVPEEIDLGNLITDEMKWSKQSNSAAAKAMSVLGMIKRTFNTPNKDIFSLCTRLTLDLTLSTVCRFGHRISKKTSMYLRRFKNVL